MLLFYFIDIIIRFRIQMQRQIQMFRQPVKPLIKQVYFLITLIIGILCITTSVILFFVVCFHLDSCIPINACTEESSGYYKFCVQDGYKFCCGGWGLDSYSCGDNIGNCRKKNSGYIKCGQVLQAQGILALLSIVFLIAVISMSCLHRRKKDEIIAYEQVMHTTEVINRQNRGTERNRSLLSYQ